MNPRDIAKAHWEYTRGALERTDPNRLDWDLEEYLYIEAFVHGFRHGGEATECSSAPRLYPAP